MIKSISHPILDIDTMSVKLVVSLDRKKNWSIYESPNGNYGTLSFIASIVMQYKSSTWSRSNSIYINNKNIFKMKHDLRMYYDTVLQSNETYMYDSRTDEVIQVDSSNSKHIIYLNNGQYLSLQPSIVYDKDNNPLPGIMMCINITNNVINATIDEYEALLNVFESTDLIADSLLLFNSYMALSSNNVNIDCVEQKPIYNNNKKPVLTGSVFQKAASMSEHDTEGSVQGVQIKKPPTDLNSI